MYKPGKPDSYGAKTFLSAAENASRPDTGSRFPKKTKQNRGDQKHEYSGNYKQNVETC